MIVYDCEIEKTIAKHDEDRRTGIEYCDGWRDFENMGLTVIGAYDYFTERYRVFCKDNLKEFQGLCDSTDLIIGFNNNQFDDVLVSYHGIEVYQDKTYDILQKVWEAVGAGRINEGDKFTSAHAGYGLDALAETNLGDKKTGHGALAPVDWQQGRIGSVIDYCLADVWLTKRLADKIFQDGKLKDPKTGKWVTIE